MVSTNLKRKFVIKLRRMRLGTFGMLSLSYWTYIWFAVSVLLLLHHYTFFHKRTNYELNHQHNDDNYPSTFPPVFEQVEAKRNKKTVPKFRKFIYNHFNPTLNFSELLSKTSPITGKPVSLYRNYSSSYYVCATPTQEFLNSKRKQSRGYLRVNANGGLNQMRAGICDMVVIARILNATMIIPELDKKSFWHDASNFSDIFDMQHFINFLKDDVDIIQKLPENLKNAESARIKFKSWSNQEYFENKISKLWNHHKVIHALKSDSRLTNNQLPAQLQKLRCRAHYLSLQFSPPIRSLAQKLVERMRLNGSYLALHLRYEKDMLAFSGCSHGLSALEDEELKTIRLKTKYWRVKDINAESQRALGLCPLTPGEVGLLLHMLQIPRDMHIYVASGEIYGGDARMDDFKAYFPNIKRKEDLATEEELEPFRRRLNAMAALDYTVSLESDIFVPTFSGNMARAVEGHRRFLGHRRTITPERKEFVRLLDLFKRGEMGKERFWESVRLAHMHSQGAPRKRKGPLAGLTGHERSRSEEAFYTNPLPDCICKNEDMKKFGGKTMAKRFNNGTKITKYTFPEFLNR